jgi:heme exporter protein A
MENLLLYQSLTGKYLNSVDLETLLLHLDLKSQQNRLAKQLSAGQKQRVALTRLWLSNAKLWILDEPFAAIDKAGIALITNRLREHSQCGGITIFSSHISLELQDVPIKHVSL